MENTKNHWRAVQLADKFARGKDYKCLFPGCERAAVDCHAIARSACVEALASDGHLYTRRYSYNQVMRMNDIADPPEIIRTSVNKASVFKGYCATHDAKLFSPAEIPEHRKRGGMFVALQLRAYSVEYCRLRSATDFMARVLEVSPSLRELNFYVDAVKAQRERLRIFLRLYLNSAFKMFFGSKTDSVEYLMIPIARNLGVSCCGCFNQEVGAHDSVIAFNLISHSNYSYLVLGVFKVMEKWLTNFLDAYGGAGMWERILNDIAFHHCEEPLISCRLWEAMSAEEQMNVRLAIRHPDFRGAFQRPAVIRLVDADFPRDVTDEMRTRFPESMFDGK